MALAKLNIIILSLLSAGNRTGYDVHKWLERYGSLVGYTTQPSQIYRQLSQIEDTGWALSAVEKRDSGPDAKVFSITDEGIRVLEEWVDTPYTPSDHPLDTDFQIRLIFSARRGPAKTLELVRTELSYQREKEKYRKELDIDLVPADATPKLRDWLRESALLQNERGHYIDHTLIAWLESTEMRLSLLVDDTD
ncbi:PadR family transcriptional regulator [Lysinibacter sp. HNR]|uniref:PadR family transcriptional regulator n=1 Tax=Lysinibacter sp. HNR TaxID=3031408 RepID=UPI002435968C|nr:PadR family transcriptional regulator [Lysinibacter sp. HNR]WGD36801.1 PadR family transcriptional regulator [Lysinibacter sp. HNR]